MPFACQRWIAKRACPNCTAIARSAAVLRSLTQILLVSGDGEFIDSVVLGVPTVPGHAGVTHLVLGKEGIQLAPKLFIGNRNELVFLFAPPAVGFPLRHPFRDAFADVDTIREKLDVARPFKRLETADNRS